MFQVYLAIIARLPLTPCTDARLVHCRGLIFHLSKYFGKDERYDEYGRYHKM